MIENKEFENHVKESWNFAKTITEGLGIDGHLSQNVILEIFKKCVSPLHYFLQDSKEDRPTKKQIDFAKSLKIKTPESYNKKELSKLITEALGNE